MEIKITLPTTAKIDFSQINWRKMFGDEVCVSRVAAFDCWGEEKWQNVSLPADHTGDDIPDLLDIGEAEEEWSKANPEKARAAQKLAETREAKRKTIDNIPFYPVAEIPVMIEINVLSSIAGAVVCFADRDERIVAEKFVWPAVCCGAVRNNSLTVRRIEDLETIPVETTGEIVLHTINASAVEPNALESYVRSLLKRAESSDTPTLVHLHNIHSADPRIGNAFNLLLQQPEGGCLRVVLSAVYSANNKTIKEVLKPSIFDTTIAFGLLSE